MTRPDEIVWPLESQALQLAWVRICVDTRAVGMECMWTHSVRALVTTAVDPQRLGGFAGRLNPQELMEINAALRAVLDLE
jgi:hypothetical protein